MKRILLGTLTVALMATHTLAQSQQLPALDIVRDAPEEVQSDAVPYENFPEFPMNGTYEEYYSHINKVLHARGESTKHHFTDDMIGTIYDFDGDGQIEYVLKNLTTCTFDGCEVSIVKHDKEANELILLLQGHFLEFRFGEDTETSEKKLYTIRHSKDFQVYNLENGEFKISAEELEPSVQFDYLANLPDLYDYLPNLMNNVYGLRNEIATTGGAKSSFAKLDINSDGSEETLIVTKTVTNCGENVDMCNYFLFTNLNNPPSLMFQAPPNSELHLGKQEVGHLKSLSFKDGDTMMTYAYDDASASYKLVTY